MPEVGAPARRSRGAPDGGGSNAGEQTRTEQNGSVRAGRTRVAKLPLIPKS